MTGLQLKRRRWGWTLFGFVVLLACTPYSSKVSQLQLELAAGRPEAALQALEDLGDDDGLPYLMDKGLLSYLSGDYAACQEALTLAQAEVEDLYTKSLSKEFLTLLLNDTAQPYQGEIYERVWIHYYRALAYLAEGDLSAAAVEGRAVTFNLQRFADSGSDEAKYSNDPFLQYFAGCLYEAYGQLNDAYINYNQALRLYGARDVYGVATPRYLVEDLMSAGARLGLGDRLERVREQWPGIEPTPLAPNEGEVLLLVSTGTAPLKRSDRIDFPIFKEREKSDDPWQVARDAYGGWYSGSNREVDYILSIALPAVAEAAPPPRRLSWSAGDREGDLELGADLGALSRQCLEDRYGRVVVKTVARALVKYWAKEKIEEEKGKVAAIIADIFGSATEIADTRSWTTLPGHIHVARLRLPAGRQVVEVGTRRNRIAGEVEVRAGNLSFLALRLY